MKSKEDEKLRRSGILKRWAVPMEER